MEIASLIESFAVVMAALYIREKRGWSQEVEVCFTIRLLGSGYDTAGLLITGEDAVRPQRKSMGKPHKKCYMRPRIKDGSCWHRTHSILLAEFL